jgi:NitT/TauT family transport system ATP-binding protein
VGQTVKLQTIDLTKVYASPSGPLPVLERVSIHVAEGELVTLVGASGCGKSTLLSIVAGLTPLSEGEVLLDGHPVMGPGSDRGLVFQSYTLFPWKTVRQNVAFGLTLKRTSKADIKEHVDRFLAVMGLTAFADSLPRQLSGGMKQRTAIARALANEPEVLLLDEPFGALDAQTRGLMHEELLSIMERRPKTVVFVTHDVREAVYLADRVAVMSARPGRIKEIVEIGRDGRSSAEILKSPEFLEKVDRLWDSVRKEALLAQAQKGAGA